MILIKLHGCTPINFLHIFKTSFTKNTSGWLLLYNSTKELLKNNIINAYVFETALQDLLTNRRRNSRSIISYGPANSRKTSILNLSLLFLKYLLIQLQVSCCWSRKNRSISINDFQGSPDMIFWQEFLKLLESDIYIYLQEMYIFDTMYQYLQ